MESRKLFKSLIETDILFRCIAATLVATMLLVSVSSCTNTEESAVDTSFSYASDEDIEHKMFSSASVTVPDTAKDVNTIFEHDGKVCLIRKAFDYSDETAYITVYNPDGSLDSSYEIKCGRALEFCCLGKELACYSGNIMEPEIGIDVYDWDGELIRHNSISRLLVGDLWITRSVASGNVICGTEGAVLIDANADVIATVKYDEFMNIEGFIAEGDKYYVLGRTADAQVTEYYELDFDKGICSRIASWEDLGGSFSTEEAIESDTYNGHIYDVDKGYIYRADIGSYSIVPVAKLDNMLVQPPKCALTTTYYLHILTDDLYCWYYPYDNGVSDLVIISPDDDLDLEERQELVVKGVGIEDDALLKYAAYVYNSSQEEYIVRLKDLGISYSNAREAQSAMLRVMSEFENGDIPDIFYGPIFDYQYWGDNGMVIDMSPYLELDNDLFPGVKAAMTDGEGHIYQVFSSFRIYGLWGRQTDFQNADLTVEDLVSLPLISDGGLKVTSYGLLYGMLRYNLKDLYAEGRLTRENISYIVSTVMSHGNADYAGGTEVSGDDFQRVTDMSDLIEESASNATDYWGIQYALKDIPVFVGYPSSGMQVRVMDPQGLVAVSSSASDPQACCDFISFMLSDEFQSYIALYQGFPVNRAVYERHLGYLKNPSSIPDDISFMYKGVLMKDYSDIDRGIYETVPMDAELADALLQQLESANTVPEYDWGIGSIISEELQTYYSQGKAVDDMADSLYSRLLLYAQENYG